MTESLLTREQFRQQLFARDNYKCVICKSPATDPHHILERRLFSDGGYYLTNGASLCSSCHLKAEMTVLSCDEIRKAAGIKIKLLPDGFLEDACYDKWGNLILEDGRRFPGELFRDKSVQRVLKEANLLNLFVVY